MLLIPWEQMDWPLEMEALFGRAAPTVLEIGYGNGDFLVDLARSRPERNYLGVEIAWASTMRLWSKIKRLQLDHVRLLQGDAALLLEHVLPRDFLDEAYLNFSDPWPKPRHHRRRVVQKRFLRSLFQCLRPGAALTMATDHAEYADWIAEMLEDQHDFENTRETTRVHHIPGRRPTRYESKAIRDGVPIHYFLWRKPPGALPSSPTPIRRVSDMPNMIFAGRLRPEGPALPPQPVLTENHGREAVHIKYMAVYGNPERSSWIVETLVQEADLSQHVALLLAPRPEGRWVLKPSAIGQPRPTWGIKRAVGRYGAWLLESQPDLALEGNTTGLEVPVEETNRP